MFCLYFFYTYSKRNKLILSPNTHSHFSILEHHHLFSPNNYTSNLYLLLVFFVFSPSFLNVFFRSIHFISIAPWLHYSVYLALHSFFFLYAFLSLFDRFFFCFLVSDGQWASSRCVKVCQVSSHSEINWKAFTLATSRE